MAKKKKRITRKKLLKEPDEFMTFSGKALRFAIKHKIQLSWGLGVVFAVIIVASGVRYFINTAENKSFALLEQNMASYETLSKKNGPEKAYLELGKEFRLIIEKYGGREGGKLARVVYADICFNAKDYDKAIELYKKSLQDFDDNQLYKTLILKSLGYTYEEKKDLQTAAKYFEMVGLAPDAIMKDEALFSLGRIYAALDRHDKSIDAFKMLMAEHPGSMYAEIAKGKVPA